MKTKPVLWSGIAGLTLFSTLFSLLLVYCGQKPSKTTATPDAKPMPMCAAKTADIDWYLNDDNKAPLFEGLDVLDFDISTFNPLVQRYFSQGLVLAYGFNHAEAARSFHYAAKLDSTCAMAHWGFAYVLGPNYNGGMEPGHYERAWNAVQKALRYANKATPKEKALIEALAKRYVKTPVDDRKALDQAYADAMREVYHRFPDDPDVGALYAESLMDMHPWDLWEKTGEPKPWTPEIVSVLENAIQKHPNHPGAHHFYIHAVEASKTPERGNASAELFDMDLVPGAGHLLHMPSHIYIRTGEYHKGTLANIRAVQVDSQYLIQCHAQGAYPLAYYPHNYHFMAATATLEGDAKWAVRAALKVAEHANRQIMKEPGWGTLQHYYATPYYVYAKFGKWDDILARPKEEAALVYPEAIRQYARGLAFLGKKDPAKAKDALNKLNALAADSTLKGMSIWGINSLETVVQIAQKVLEAEILSAEGKTGEAERTFNEAIAIEDQLNYDEPPDWFFSVRHHLGATQIKAGKYKEAVTTFEDDLKTFPKNYWALTGLATAYEKMENREKAMAYKKQVTTMYPEASARMK